MPYGFPTLPYLRRSFRPQPDTLAYSASDADKDQTFAQPVTRYPNSGGYMSAPPVDMSYKAGSPEYIAGMAKLFAKTGWKPQNPDAPATTTTTAATSTAAPTTTTTSYDVIASDTNGSTVAIKGQQAMYVYVPATLLPEVDRIVKHIREIHKNQPGYAGSPDERYEIQAQIDALVGAS